MEHKKIKDELVYAALVSIGATVVLGLTAWRTLNPIAIILAVFSIILDTYLLDKSGI